MDAVRADNTELTSASLRLSVWDNLAFCVTEVTAQDPNPEIRQMFQDHMPLFNECNFEPDHTFQTDIDISSTTLPTSTRADAKAAERKRKLDRLTVVDKAIADLE